jgi:nucleoside-diphosphate-sugar epimerase
MSDVPVDNMTALITGASGFLGSHLCERLLARGAEVHATSRAKRASHHPRLRWWQCELTAADTAEGLLREIRPHVIFHLAGRVTAASDLQLVLPTFQSLLGSTVNLLTAATAVGCRRLVLTGSLTEPYPGRPDAPPNSPYAAAKWAATAYARMFHELYGTPVVVLRPFMTYGPGQNEEKVIPHVILSLLRGVAPRLASGQWRADWTYIDDVIDGFLLAATRPGIEGSDLDLGSGAVTSTREVVRKIVDLVQPQSEPVFGALPDRPSEQVRVADVGKSRNKLGWEPSTSLDQGLARTVRWYQHQVKGVREAQEA